MPKAKKVKGTFEKMLKSCFRFFLLFKKYYSHVSIREDAISRMFGLYG